MRGGGINALPYHQVVVYGRVGDVLTPFRRTTYWRGKAWAYHMVQLSMEEIFGNHTSWVADQLYPRARAA